MRANDRVCCDFDVHDGAHAVGGLGGLGQVVIALSDHGLPKDAPLRGGVLGGDGTSYITGGIEKSRRMRASLWFQHRVF
jgi:hypothetical protein